MRKKLSKLGILVAASTLVFTTATFAAPTQAGAGPTPPQTPVARQANPPGPKGGPGAGPQHHKGGASTRLKHPKHHRMAHKKVHGKTNPPGHAYGRKNQSEKMNRPDMGQKDQQMPQNNADNMN